MPATDAEALILRWWMRGFTPTRAARTLRTRWGIELSAEAIRQRFVLFSEKY